MYSALDGSSFQALVRQVAQAWELPVADLDFDNCLVYDFEHPDLWFDGRWRFGSSLNAEGSAFAFVTGIDALSFRGHGVRMESLWPVDETASGVPNNDLFTLGLPPLEGWHVVSVFYRASGMSDSDSRVIGNGWLYWGDWPSTRGHIFMETRLPDSHGQWKRVLGITYIPETPAPDHARFVLRLWGTGRIEYDELRICSFPEAEPQPASDCSTGCQFVSITP